MSNKLVDMELDEISLVKKGANQYSTVSIAKSLSSEEEEMGNLFDENGDLVDVESLDYGDVVFDEEGNAFEVSEEDTGDDAEEEVEDDEVEKAFYTGAVKGAKNAFNSAKRGWQSGTQNRNVRRNPGARPRLGEGETLQDATDYGFKRLGSGAQHLSENRLKYGAGAAGAGVAGAAGGYGYNRRKDVGKSLREEFSKALTDDDRESVISKAMDAISQLEEQNEIALEIAKSEQEQRIFNDYVSIAKTYDLPFEDDVVASAMMEAEANLSEEACAVIAKSFELASNLITQEIGYDELGSDAMYVVDDALDEIGKSGDPEAITQLLENNPELYEAYLAEKN